MTSLFEKKAQLFFAKIVVAINLGDFHGMMEFLVLSVKSSKAVVSRR